MGKYVWIGIGGCLGALARYTLGVWVANRFGAAFPLGTFVINVSGSLLLGFLATVGTDAGLLPGGLRLGLTTGFLGAYTTFSTWTLETWRLVEAGSYLLAAFNVVGSVAAGLAGAWIGLVLGRLLA